MTGGYERFAASLAGRGDVPDPQTRDGLPGGATAVWMIWTGDYLDAARRLQDTLVGPARTAAVRVTAG